MTTNTHLCPGGCGKQVDDSMLACGYHWKLVPCDLQNEVYRTYRARQRSSDKGEAIRAHQTAMDAAITAMTGRKGGE